MKSVEYWIKAINEEESDKKALDLFFIARDETPVGSNLRQTRSIAIHKGVDARLLKAIKRLYHA